MEIFQYEIDSGLSKVLEEQKSVAYLSTIELTDTSKDKIKPFLGSAVAEKLTDDGLYCLASILTSIGWNGNDDVFTKEETWAARHTPSHKPFNYGHNEKDIIGHITGNYVIDKDYNTIADDSALEDVADSFHLVTAAVLYKNWRDEKLQERMDSIIAEIGEGKWFVSMEAWFKGFDYALIGSNNENYILARSKETAFLTKYLRAYGGSGKYEDYKIGRVMRQVSFAGKGLVENPANPDSIIFANIHNFTGTILNEVPKEPKVVVVADLNGEKEIMSTELETKLAEATKLLEKASQDKDLAVTTAVAAAKKIHDEAIVKLESDKSAVEASLVEANKKVTELTTKLDESDKSLVKIQTEALAEKRFNELKLLTEVNDTEKLTLASMSEETFAMLVAVAKKSVKAPNPETALETATPNEEPTLATAGGNVDDTRKSLSDFLVAKGFAPKVQSK